MARTCGSILVMLALLAVSATAVPVPYSSDCLTPATKISASGQALYPVQFQATSQATVAKHFTIQYFDTYKVLNNTSPYNEEVYVLYQCGSTPPAAADIPAGAKVLQIPLAVLSVPDTSAFAYLQALGVSNRIAYAAPFTVDACMQALAGAGCNKVAITPDGSVAAIAQADAVSAFFIDYADGTSPTTVAVTGYADPGILNRAEWLKYVGAFFNLEALANTLYSTKAAAYATLAAAVAAVAPAVTSSARPLVAWVAYIPAYPAYSIPATWSVSITQYKVDLTQDGGGRMHSAADLQPYGDAANGITFTATGGLSMSNQTLAYSILHKVLLAVDYVIDETGYTGIRDADVTLATFRSFFGFTNATDLTTFKWFSKQQLYRHDGITTTGITSDWYEGAIVEPDLLLLDFVRVLQPAVATSVSGAGTPRWLRNLATTLPTVITASQCTTLQGCAQTALPLCPSIYAACNGTVVYATSAQPCAPTSCPLSANGTTNGTTTPSPPAAFPPSPPPSPKAGARALPVFVLPALAALLAVLALLL